MALQTLHSQNDTPGPGRNSIDIETIRARYAHYGPTDKLKPHTAVLHIRQLLDYIDANTTADTETGHSHPCDLRYCERWNDENAPNTDIH